MSSVLIIDDDRLVIEQLTELISSFGHEVAFVPKPHSDKGTYPLHSIFSYLNQC